jgi:hypothetical protein
MAGGDGKGDLGRIEDFIALAKEGKDVKVAIDLKKQLVTQKVPPGDTEDVKREIDMYLFMAIYTFSAIYTFGAEKQVNQISKVYMLAFSEESPDDLKINTAIANARLKMDYQRLKDANITFEEKYF